LNKKSLHLEGIIGFPGVTNRPIGIECTTFCGGVKAIEKSYSAYGSLRCARLRGPNFFAAAHEYGPPRGCRFQVGWQATHRGHCHRFGVDSDSNSTETWSGWQICGILWYVVIFFTSAFDFLC